MDTWQSVLLLVLGAAGHAVLWIALVNRLHGLRISRRIIDALTLACVFAFIAIPTVILWNATTRNPWRLAGAGIIYLCLCSILLLWSAWEHWWVRRGDHARDLLLGNHTQVLEMGAAHGTKLLAPGIVRLLGRLPGNEVLRIHVHEKLISIPGLPPELDGLRIAHLSDFHMSGRIAQDYYATVVERVNQWQPEIVAITGDIVETEPCIPWIGDTLGKLRAEEGVFFVLGNHDWKIDHRRIRRSLVEAGLVDLGGKSEVLALRGEQVLVAGNELPWFPMQQEFGGDTATFRLLLAHGPDQIDWAKQHGFHLMLAGHNHGGQIRFPLLGAIVSPSLSGTRFSGGTYQQGETVLHVSRGTGSLSPLRWNCPPEIALLTLKSATLQKI